MNRTPVDSFLALHVQKECSFPTTALPKTNSSNLKMDGWNTSYYSFLLGWPIFGGYVRFGSVFCLRGSKFNSWLASSFFSSREVTAICPPRRCVDFLDLFQVVSVFSSKF